jgi:beta-galactosidase
MERLTYRDGRFWKGSVPFFLVAAEYQYYRDRRAHWDDRLRKLAASGVSTVSFYIPWRHHLRADLGGRSYDFSGRTRENRDLTGFLARVEGLGLRMIAKPGPFVHSELNIGGLPDIVSPSFDPARPAARRHDGSPARWSYDDSILPAPLDAGFDALAREWLEAVGDVLRPFAAEGGPLIAIQLNDETLYCTSNDPPWHIGYDEDGMRFYRRLLAERYGDIGRYNRLHATSWASFEAVPAPALEASGLGGWAPAAGFSQAAEPGAPGASPPGPRRREDLLLAIDWADYHWRLRRDLYLRYKGYLGIDLPYLTNFAGITPPIVENIPGKEGEKPSLAAGLARLYPEWWFAMNRIDQDADAYEYGMISWLGVAAYDRDVFARYLNTARRARGINMEENWGFGTLYDPRSRYPLVPFFQTLLSVAGGATGYVIFVGVGGSHWDDELDRVTRKQCSVYPSHAPIDAEGRLTPMYFAAARLNRWFAANGEALLSSREDIDASFLLYPPYAAVSSWIPDRSAWGLEGQDIPRCGREGFEEFSRSLQDAGYAAGLFELSAPPGREDEVLRRLRACRGAAIHSAFFMGAAEQETLARFIEEGGRLFISGELPAVDLEWRPCTRLAEAVRAAVGREDAKVLHRRENLFADGGFARVLAEAGVEPRVRTSERLRALVHRGSDDLFVFFFDLGSERAGEHWIEVEGRRLELRLGPRSCGVVRLRGERIAAYLLKGENEVEGTRARVGIRLGGERVERVGDLSSEGA